MSNSKVLASLNRMLQFRNAKLDRSENPMTMHYFIEEIGALKVAITLVEEKRNRETPYRPSDMVKLPNYKEAQPAEVTD